MSNIDTKTRKSLKQAQSYCPRIRISITCLFT